MCKNSRTYFNANRLFITKYDQYNCPLVNGDWSEWSNYSECSSTCGNGTKTRNRTCNNPAPKFGGAECLMTDNTTTALNETQESWCKNKECPGKN